MKHSGRFLLAGLSILALSLTVGGVLSAKKGIKLAYGYENGDAATYYTGISDSLTGNQLLTKLQALNSTKRRNLISYNSLPNYFKQTDPGKTSNQVTAFYSGTSATYSGNMNKEHVWPFSKLYINTGSRGQNDVEKDLHHIRPSMQDENEGRGNSFFTEPTGQGWDPGSLGDETYRGDSARIIFYCIVADANLSLVDRDYDSKDNHTMGKLSTLLKWNLQYTVNARENVRNEAVESIQGHRNPFIDHPEYACRIWGDYNSATKAACASQPIVPPDPDMTGLTLNVHERHIEIGETFSISATIEPSELNGKVELDWYSDDESIASYKNGVVKGLKNGTTKIVVCTTDFSFVDECKVVVGTGESSKSSSSGGCSGSIITSSIILSTLSFIGIDLIVFKKLTKKKENN